MDLVNKYVAEIEQHPILTPEEEKALARAAKTGDLEAKQRLVVSNLRFVVKAVHKFRRHLDSGKYDFLDLVQEGNTGLLQAVESFDPERGYRFLTYANWWIRAKIMAHLVKSYSLVKIGTTVQERRLFFQFSKFRELAHIADPEDRDRARRKLAAEMDITVDIVRDIEERFGWNDIPLDAPMPSGDSVLLDFICDDQQIEEDISDREQSQAVKDEIHRVIGTLSDREKRIIELRFLTEPRKSLDQIADEYKLSRERIRQLQVQALSKMRRRIKKIN